MSRTICCGLLVCLAAQSLFAQTGAASLQGTVRDASGAVVPAGHVSAVRPETGRKYESTTNEAGLFLFPPMDPGEYRVTVTATGMQPWERTLRLATGQQAVLDAILTVGSAASEVTVTGGAALPVETVDSTLATVVEHQRIEELPLNGRSVATLVVQTSPGVDEGSGGTNRSSSTLPRVFGLKWGAMEFVQDGASLMDRYWGFLAIRPPGLDTVQEFRVETNNSSAKYDHPATAIIITKNGTNALHGSAFETARNSGLAATRQRQDFFSKPPPLIRNEYGASVGGPILFPKVYNGRNRTFFFFSYEGYDLRQYSTVGTQIPTAAMRQGDFSSLTAANGLPITVYDPASTATAADNYGRTPFPGNVIPAARQSAFAKSFVAAFPLPNLTGVNPLSANNLQWASPNNRDDRTFTFRLDHKLSDADQIFLRGSYGTADTFAANGFNNAPVTVNNETNFIKGNFVDPTVAASWIHVVSPTLFAETLMNYSIERWFQIPGDRTRNYAAALGLPNPFGKLGYPEVRNTGLTGLDSGEGANLEKDITRIFTIDENMTKVWRKHEIQFGGRFHYERLADLPQQQFVINQVQFNSQATALYDPASGQTFAARPNTGFDFANLYLGAAGSYGTYKARDYYHFGSNQFAGYIQDNYKVTSRLTLNFGLRLERLPIARELNQVQTGFDPANQAIITGLPLDRLYSLGATTTGIVNLYTAIGTKFETPDQAGLPAALSRTDAVNFGPRFGFAYKLADGARPIVIRGGYARYSFPIPARYYVQRSRTNVPFSTQYLVDYSQAVFSPDGKTNYMLRNAPPVLAGQGTANLLDINNPAPVARGGFFTSYFAPYLPAGRADEWNITLEKEILRNMVARASYIGTHGFHLDQLYDTNQAPSTYVWEQSTGTAPPSSGAFAGVATRLWPTAPYGTVEEYTKNGYSYFSGMSLSLERRFSQGAAFQMFYVMSNATRLGGNGWYDSFAVDPNIFLPGSVPADFNRLNRLLNYERDPEIPKHHLRWNWVVDLPFGRGKRIGHNAGGVADAIIGGWQFAGSGNAVSRYFALGATNWGPTSKVQVYGLKYPVQDCRSGRCFASSLYDNGYIPPTQINAVNAAGTCTGVCGLPASYQPAITPINNIPGTQYYGTNNVSVALANGSTQIVPYNNGYNPLQNQYLLAPFLWTWNASLFKSFRIREAAVLRLNADFFNVLNQPGLNLPDSTTGLISTQSSAQVPRQLQLTLRLIW